MTKTRSHTYTAKPGWHWVSCCMPKCRGFLLARDGAHGTAICAKCAQGPDPKAVLRANPPF